LCRKRKRRKGGREGPPTIPIQELSDPSSRSYDSDDNNTMTTAECEEKMREET
jgi:hypothetical protein